MAEITHTQMFVQLNQNFAIAMENKVILLIVVEQKRMFYPHRTPSLRNKTFIKIQLIRLLIRHQILCDFTAGCRFILHE